LVSAFGGMGSLNDLVLDPVNGHRLRPGQVESANADLERCQSAVYAAARMLQRELDREGA
jgi:hypothetical protein